MYMKKLQWIILIVLCAVFVMLWNIRKEQKNIQQDIAGEKIEEVDQVSMTFLDIGQGDATFVEFPDGQQMLIDCAMDGRILEALGRVMDFYDKTIDYLVVTHPDLDHYGGCQDVLERFDIKNVWYTGVDKSYDDQFNAFMYAIQEEDAQYSQISSEDVLTIASTTLHILYPDHDLTIDLRISGSDKEPNANNTSVIMRFDFVKSSVLLMGDAEEELEEYLLSTYEDEILDVNILKLGHHGSDSSSILEFLEVTSPEHAIASCGFENKFGHPSRRVLKRLERMDSQVWRTDLQGDINVILRSDYFEILSQQEI